MKNDEIQKCKNYILRLLSYRQYSRYEIEQKLKKKDYEKSVCEQSINDLENVGLIDDDEFADMWVRSRMRHRPRGKYLLKLELKKKGVADHIINRVLTEYDKKYDEEEIANRLAQKRMKRYKNIETLKAKRRIFSYLKRRGFRYEAIYSALDNIFTDE